MKKEDEERKKNDTFQFVRNAVVIAATQGEVEEAAGRYNAGGVAAAALDGAGGKPGQPPCPLIGFDAGAIAWSMPGALQELNGAAGGAFPAKRVWTTLLTTAMLVAADECLLRKSRHRDGFDETAVDQGMAWLDAVAEEFPGFKRMREQLAEEAADYVEAWAAAQDHAIGATKEAWQVRGCPGLSASCSLRRKPPPLSFLRLGRQCMADQRGCSSEDCNRNFNIKSEPGNSPAYPSSAPLRRLLTCAAH